MARDRYEKRTFKVFRYDPATGDKAHFERFQLAVADESITTVLDALLRIQRDHDQSLAFRYACRVSMCGSCGMVINGKEGLACKTVIANLRGKVITLRPLNHFPIVKDLVVDLDPFFEKYRESIPYFEAFREHSEPALIRPDSRERKAIELATECIACGCCVSSCTMAYWHKTYLGPAALNRAFTLLADSRDALEGERLIKAVDACYQCRSEFNCTGVCPKDISPTRAIKYIQRMAFKESFRRQSRDLIPEQVPQPSKNQLPKGGEWSRRRFLSGATFGLFSATALLLGGLVATASIAPAMRRRRKKWVRVGPMEDLTARTKGVKTINIRYQVEDGFYRSVVSKAVLVARGVDTSTIVAFSSRCTHLGCTVHWDEDKNLFLCACHGGIFYPDGRVKAGPPPRPLDRYETNIKDGDLFILEA